MEREVPACNAGAANRNIPYDVFYVGDRDGAYSREERWARSSGVRSAQTEAPRRIVAHGTLRGPWRCSRPSSM